MLRMGVAIMARDIQLDDIIIEGKRSTRVTEKEHRLCGIHINNNACYNAPEQMVEVLNGVIDDNL